jgi:hypothetical protein
MKKAMVDQSKVSVSNTECIHIGLSKAAQMSLKALKSKAAQMSLKALKCKFTA